MTDKQYTDDEILEMLRNCLDKHDSCVPKLFNDMPDTCSVSLVIRRFGSWAEARDEAGIENNADHLECKRAHSDEEILDNLRKCASRNDGKCTVKLFQAEDDLVAPSVVIGRFESWSDAKIEAGIDTDARKANHRPREFTDEDYLDLIRDCYEKHGKATKALFNEESEERADHPTSAAVRKHFGSWLEAKKQLEYSATE